MPEGLTTAEPVESTGATEGPAEPTTPTEAPQADAGQSAATGQGEAPPAEDTFFDPRDLDGKPELTAAYKNMQRAFTKRMQELGQHRQKIAAYDQFQRDPATSLQQLAAQYGYRLSPAQAQAMAAAQEPAGDTQNWEPKSWDEVLQKAEERAEQRLLAKMQPVFKELETQKKSTIERELTEIDPAWQQYEDGMRENLTRHPTLANDPATLYRMSVPPEIIESRAVQKALKKMEAKGKSSQVSAGSQTPKKSTQGMPDEAIPFAQAVEIAKAKLAEQGIFPGK